MGSFKNALMAGSVSSFSDSFPAVALAVLWEVSRVAFVGSFIGSFAGGYMIGLKRTSMCSFVGRLKGTFESSCSGIFVAGFERSLMDSFVESFIGSFAGGCGVWLKRNFIGSFVGR